MNRSASVLVALFACVALGGGLLSVGVSDSSASPEQTARGIVFHDVNGNEEYDAGDRPLPGVRVSDGRRIVTTDGKGEYALPVTDDAILFVIKPRGWRTPLSENNLPQFFYVHKPNGSPASKFPGVPPTGPLPDSVDFPLTPQTEPEQFQAILFGDTQPRNQQEVDWIAHDVIEELIGTDAAFGVTLGDIVFDDLDVMEPLNRTIALLGIPWYNVIGNHDINYDAQTRQVVNETYERVYGPSYYAFDYGPTHFLVLDNIEWTYNSAKGEGAYSGGIGPEQLEFIRTDLEQIPQDQMVVLLMHIPLTDTQDRHGLYRLIEQRPFCISVSGHTHTHEHVWITDKDGWEGPQPHHHIINVTVCGSWWSGAPDERGIPHTTMADGAPNGYSLLSFDGTDYKLDFRAAGRSPDYQMEIDAPDVVTQADLSKQTISVNVFNGSEKSVVELKVGDGEWRRMTKVDVVDPKFQRTFDREAELLAKKEAWRSLPKPKPSTHVWQISLPSDLPVGTHSLQVRATDHLDRVFNGQRILRIE
ncbi:MAG: calcineurin-like phosphoesterase family protein [Planctomycetaceae bacterium]|nr:calcineurin-like phosphoesterase family protein [Planctomycetaceae bacterium]